MIKIITNDYEFHDDSDDSDDSDDGLMNNSVGTFDVYCINLNESTIILGCNFGDLQIRNTNSGKLIKILAAIEA